MPTKKRPDISSVQGAIDTARAIATTKLEPTRKLDKAEQAIFTRLVRSRETATWSENDLEIATGLAEVMALCNDYTARLKLAGPTAINERGITVANPLLVARDNAFRSVVQLQRLLGLSASQKGVSSVQQSKRNMADREARKLLERVSDEELI
jgi:hypothetical protein